MAKDLFHQTVTIRIDRVRLEIDLGSEKVFAAEKDGQKIAVEIKSFINPSNVNDFHNALGQFLSYRLALQMTEPQRVLYLAVPIDIFNTFFQERFTKAAIRKYALNIIACNPNQEEIVQWKN